MTISTPVLTAPTMTSCLAKHIVWGDEAKPLVLIRELAALLNGCRPHPQNSLAVRFPPPLANFLQGYKPCLTLRSCVGV